MPNQQNNDKKNPESHTLKKLSGFTFKDTLNLYLQLYLVVPYIIIWPTIVVFVISIFAELNRSGILLDYYLVYFCVIIYNLGYHLPFTFICTFL